MNILISLLGGNTVDPWISNSFPIIRIVLMCIVAICAVGVIVTTIMQGSESEGGTNVITGQKNESYFSQNSGATRDAMIKKLTIIFSSVIVICTVLYFVSLIIYTGN